MKRLLAAIPILLCLLCLPAKAQHSVTVAAGAPTPGTPACTTTPSFTFNIYRGTTSGAESTTPLNATPIPSATAGGFTYTDSTVALGNTYYYKYSVTEVCGTLNIVSALSNEVSQAFPSQPTPAALSVNSAN